MTGLAAFVDRRKGQCGVQECDSSSIALEVAREALEEIRDLDVGSDGCNECGRPASALAHPEVGHDEDFPCGIAARALRSMAAPAPTPAAAPVPAAGVRATELLAALRDQGWAVAIHNDYRLNGVPMTFWGFSRGDRFLKGEGATDIEALLIVADQADIDAATTAVVPVETPPPCGKVGPHCVNGPCPNPDCDDEVTGEWSENSEFQCQSCDTWLVAYPIGDGSWRFSMAFDDADEALEAACDAGYVRRVPAAPPTPAQPPTERRLASGEHGSQSRCGLLFASSTSQVLATAARLQHESECQKCAAPPSVPPREGMPPAKETMIHPIDPQPFRVNGTTGPMWGHRDLGGLFAEHVMAGVMLALLKCPHGIAARIERVGTEGTWAWIVSPATPPSSTPPGEPTK